MVGLLGYCPIHNYYLFATIWEVKLQNFTSKSVPAELGSVKSVQLTNIRNMAVNKYSSTFYCIQMCHLFLAQRSLWAAKIYQNTYLMASEARPLLLMNLEKQTYPSKIPVVTVDDILRLYVPLLGKYWLVIIWNGWNNVCGSKIVSSDH